MWVSVLRLTMLSRIYFFHHLQIIITTYQTLNNDFPLRDDEDDTDSDEWLENNG
jgi:hypothetical protein